MKILKWIGSVLLLFFLFLLVWGTLIEPTLLDVKEETAVIPNLPEEWKEKQIGVISDFQLGMWGDNEATIEKAVAVLVKNQPAAVLVLGDYLYKTSLGDDKEIQRAVDMLVPLMEKNIPVYSVLGNHDYQMGSEEETINPELATKLTEKLTSIGVIVLQNESYVLPGSSEESEPFYLVGIGPHIPKKDKPVELFQAIEPSAARFVMMHNPVSFNAIQSGEAPMAVAGHTHGGQIRIPFTPNWTILSMVKTEPFHADGWIMDYGKQGNQLYVNRGIGFSIFPIRINCKPELTLFTLQRP